MISAISGGSPSIGVVISPVVVGGGRKEGGWGRQKEVKVMSSLQTYGELLEANHNAPNR